MNALLREAEDVLEEGGYPFEDEEFQESQEELAAAEARDWFRYNVIMTGRVPLIDEQRGTD